jgi:hypothetical protein
VSRRRRAGISLVEVTTAIPLLVSLMLLLHRTVVLAFLASDLARSTGRTVQREVALESELARRVRSGLPLEAISIAPDGRLVEGPVAGALRAWKVPEAVAVRTETGHVVIAASGGQLVRFELGGYGRTTRELLAPDLVEARFEVLRGVDGRASGVAWEVRTRTGASSGFAGRRTEVEPATPPALGPLAAPRWTHGGGR